MGVIGGGQLARMMISPSVELGLRLQVLAEAEDVSASLAASAIGDHRDAEAVLAFAAGVEVVTFDHEHVPQEVLRALLDAGARVRPGPAALAVAQDKILMRERLSALGVPVPEWAVVDDATGLSAFLDGRGEVIVKTPRGGYDGHGVRRVSEPEAIADWFAGGGSLLVEELVPFRRELAQLVARRPSGEIAAWPLVETVQRDGVCVEVTAPAPGADALAAEAVRIATLVADRLDVTGVLAVELFETVDGRLLVNELAMRPHNSGHWTIDGAVTSQFEQHLRAVLDLPLGDPSPRAPWSVMVNVLGGPPDGMTSRYPDAMATVPAARFHAYGKDHRPGRKVGHVTVSGSDLAAVTADARAAAAFFDR